jgi:uncharacterized iron-regulated protein
MKNILVLCLLFVSLVVFGQKRAFEIYDHKGDKTTYQALVDQALQKEVVLFGEFHDNPIHHWLQLELVIDLQKQNQQLTLGAEMMEADNQLVIDEYLAGMISEKKLISESKTWVNFETDYLPLLQFAKKNKLPFVATNVPRRYASMVYKHGLDSLNRLSDLAKSYMAPLPITIDTTLSTYQEILEMGMGHGGDNLPKSQALKDATMAHFILENSRNGHLLVHFNGAFHSKQYEGIYWYLRQANKQLKILTISVVEQDDINALAEGQIGQADFIIATPTNMTKTH